MQLYPPPGASPGRDPVERSASVLVNLRRHCATDADHVRLLERVLDQPELPANVALPIRLHLRGDRRCSEPDGEEGTAGSESASTSPAPGLFASGATSLQVLHNSLV